MKILIVGGVAGGMSAATRMRRLDEAAEIIVFERGHYVSFANCGLPYYVGGLIEDRSALLLQTPESLASRFRLDVRIDHEVTGIDRAARTVSVRDTVTGTVTTEGYDRLVLAAGATTRSVLPAGSDLPVHTLRTVDDVDQITALLTRASGPGSAVTGPAATVAAVVIGAGFIGLEAVENLVLRGVQVTAVEFAGQVLGPLDPEMAAPVAAVLKAHGVDVRVDTSVRGASAGRVLLSDGTDVAADLIIEATGVLPDTSLAAAAGLRIGESGAIWVDDTQRTSDPLIYAVGDGAEKIDAISGGPTRIAMAGLANRHGRAAADSIADSAAGASGVSVAAEPAFGVAIVGVFGTTVAMVGWSERRLLASGRGHRVVHTHPSDHAGYYPGAEQMSVKLLVDAATDAILGAQIVGGHGVDKRIDVIATAMAGGLTASALSRLELAYAPQYGSAKDPINQLGYVADNLAAGTTRSLQWHELAAALAAGEALVDVRTAGEFAAGSIPGAINVPLDELRDRFGDLPAGPLVVHCQVGQRGHTAARLLSQLGREVRNLDGGYKTWAAGAAALAASPRAAVAPAPPISPVVPTLSTERIVA
ncbi:FAD-dependent oxidoreductase [Cryobacterium sp. 10I1]|uniref:FAD-dependent oxidoreductase n=1 Tax=unclassified Cryobacterium TaxID=2649013 RepID=UPI002B22DDC9|nr:MULTISPECIES: FAD-dependent oxidoreductase [unclassified Cryobacterium]MEB0001324.1 FAD-dependent oxidoreductase [Cryobacterium sp. RTC2.1]MEB0303962.1 FAD-dependent oxidoreductase [Cryobacterium sp. 10I1]